MTGIDASDSLDREVRPVGLRTNDDSALVATAFRRPSLSWRLDAGRGGVLQRAYELQLAADAAFAELRATSGRIEVASPIAAPWPGEDLSSREVAWARVRVWTERGVTAWSDPLRIEGALFAAEDWIARPISPSFNVGRTEPAPVPLLRRAFTLEQPPATARLYATALGTCAIWINGRPVAPDLLEPGWTEYGQRLPYASYDVAALLRPGENVVAAELADGWWRGNLTWIPRRAVYGETTALLAQLELTSADGARQVIASDESWRGSTGALLAADIYDGCEIDTAREPCGWREPGFDAAGWSEVVRLPLPAGLEQRSLPPVRVVRTLAPKLGRRDGVVTVDAGQNLTGYLRLTVSADTAASLTVRHAEVLEADSALFTAALRTAKATDQYRIGPGRMVLEPRFTYHGFRYAEIALGQGVTLDQVEVCVVASDLREIGRFACSESLLDKLFANIVWSQRGNFLAIPTDCPQRDERLGWTGDIQVFGTTACANFDSRAFLASWLVDLALAQAADGQVTSVVPNVIQGHPYEFGGIGWADAATLLPWALYEAYGDREVLARQFACMRAWVDYGESRLDPAGVWTGDFHLGDWLDPGAPPDKPEQATTDRDYIASAYLSFSAGKLAETARVLGHADLAQRYAALSRRVAAATWSKWGEAALATQTGCALAIAFAIAPPEAVPPVGARLAQLVEAAGGRIATGFLGTPVVLPALTQAGQHEAAYRLLLNRESPGWLYQVLNGATTTWERWDAILPDGSINRGDMAADDAESMTSFNHYAYGSVGAWLYRTLAGIAPGEPGYTLVEFAPQPGGPITWAEASIDTPLGLAAIRWERDGEQLTVQLTVPPAARGRFRAPAGWRLSDADADADAGLQLGSGEHRLTLAAERAGR